MSIYDIGRICVKTMGREAGSYCVVVDIIDKNYVLIDGLKIRRRRANYKHIEPTAETITIKKGASHNDITTAIKKAKLEKKMNEIVPIPTK
jgi:large subunit ribosomal protein L14e